jgi:hypothetical protein
VQQPQEVSVDGTQRASAEHLEFDRLCERVEEFDYLPAVEIEAPQSEPAEPGERTELDQLILAGLVSPV